MRLASATCKQEQDRKQGFPHLTQKFIQETGTGFFQLLISYRIQDRPVKTGNRTCFRIQNRVFSQSKMNTIHYFLILFIVISGSFNSSDGFWGLKNTTSDLKINFKYSLAKIHFSLFKTCIPVLIRQACSWKMITYRSKRKKPCTGLFSGFHFWARFQTGYRTGL